MTQLATPLANRHCAPRTDALDQDAIALLLPQVPAWSVVDGALHRDFHFKNYYQTIAFVNALAWMTHQQDHHPDLAVGYNVCGVSYSTHSAGATGGLTDNDFICAARADAIFGHNGVEA